MKVRKPAVAGQFYPGKKEELDNLLDDVLNKEKASIRSDLSQKSIIGGVVPHAGYIFSAYQAMHIFQIMKQHAKPFDTIIIINPNHSGVGNDMAFDSNDFWETPYGKVEVDKEFRAAMNLPSSEQEEKREHSGEVMLPLLQYALDYPFKIAPITLTIQNYSNASHLAKEIFQANKLLNKNIFLIASSDFSHFVTPEYGKKQDDQVVQKIQEMDSEGIDRIIREKHISVCGYGPIMTLMEYSRLITDKPKNEILRRGSSGDVIPSNEVVDYISILFYKENE